jgi:hypothetical protein
MAGYGLPNEAIARVLDVDVALLRRDYPKELGRGAIKANAKVAENLYRKATGDGREAVTAAIFWLKTRAHWKETSVHEVSGPGGAPIETVGWNPTDVAKVLLGMLGSGGTEADTRTPDDAEHRVCDRAP